MTYRKKLIEVALPLEAINMESAREKSIRHGHPSTLHLWWARRPLAACRAVLWSSLVDDPSSWPDRFPTEEDQTQERQRLFDILGRITIEETRGRQKQVVRGLVSWDDIKDPAVIEEAQREIARSLAWGRGEEPPTKPDAVREYIAKYAPPVYDPFAGGGSIPLEAQRLGLEAHASDLNPVAVLINKALIEIPPKFKDMPPVNPEDRKRAKLESWKGAQGLAADVRYYGKWMRDEAFKRIGHLYPKVKVVREQDGSYRHATEAEIEDPKAKVEELTVLAWLWARTVKCPNPACGCQMPLVGNFKLSTKKKEEAWIEPYIVKNYDSASETSTPRILFKIGKGEGKVPDGTIKRKGANCIICSAPATFKYIREESKAGKLSQTLMATAVLSKDGKIFLPPPPNHEEIAYSALPEWKPNTDLPQEALSCRVQLYGLNKHSDLFTYRQLTAITTFVDLIEEAREKITQDALKANFQENGQTLNEDGHGAKAYEEAVSVYCGLAISKATDLASTLCHWQSNPGHLKLAPTFARHSLPMSWDYAEGNPFSNYSGIFLRQWELIQKVLMNLPVGHAARAEQIDATKLADEDLKGSSMISTDPPYYDNIGYADLSDFFYTWLRHSLKSIYSELFNTILVPKIQELVATPHRFNGDRKKAQDFFEDGLNRTFRAIKEKSSSDYPVTVYYAYKQAEGGKSSSQKANSFASTGWETMLEGLIRANLAICGTWPIRTERLIRYISIGTNALASSIVLVCRPRPTDAPKATRRQFLNELKRELPKALKTLQQGNIAPVDLAQASIGPGMAVFSKYAAVLESDGTPMRVRTALQLINQILDEFLAEQEGEFDRDTRWALTWFEQHQYADGPYGEAETLSTARNTSVKGMEEAGILIAKGGKVRLLKRDELPQDWQPEADNRTPDWEATQYLIHTLLNQGELAAAELLARLGAQGENARDLAYRLYTICDRKGWAAEGVAYNSLVIAWPEISRLASETERATPVQGTLGV
jgi:putative DNA methylase